MYNKAIVIELTLITLMVAFVFFIVVRDQFKEYIRHKKFMKEHHDYKRKSKS